MDKSLKAHTIASYTQAIALNPHDAQSYKDRGEYYKYIGERELAIVDFTKAIEINPEEAEAFKLRGDSYHYGKSLEGAQKAIADYTKAIEINPDNAYSYYNSRSSAYHDLGDDEKDIADFTVAQGIDPQDGYAYFYWGCDFYSWGATSRALAYMTKAIKLNYQTAYIYLARGRTYAELEQYELAIADYNQALKIDRQDEELEQQDLGELYAYRAIAYYYTEQYTKAIAYYSQLLDDYGDDLDNVVYAKKKRAFNYYKSGEYKKAIVDCQDVLAIDSQNFEACVYLTKIYFELQEYKKAIVVATKAIDFPTEYIHKKNNQAHMYQNRGQIYVQLQQYEQAIFDYSQAIELKPREPSNYLRRGKAYYESQQFTQAIADLDLAIDKATPIEKRAKDLTRARKFLAPHYAEAYQYKGLAYRALSQKSEAETCFAKAQEYSS